MKRVLMSTFDMKVSVPLETFVCPDTECNTEFSIQLILRPSEMYKEEYPYAEGNVTNWAGDSDIRPYCPCCGKKVEKV